MGTMAKTQEECREKPYPVTIKTKELVSTGKIIPAAYPNLSGQIFSRAMS
jgi:hypothetical protein